MDVIEYRIRRGAIAEYELNVLKSGLCTALLPGSFYASGEEMVIRCDPVGCTTMETCFSDNGTALLDSFKIALHLIRSVIESYELAEKYLIREKNISFAPDDLYFTGEGRAKLLLRSCDPPESLDFQDRIIKLCCDIYKKYPFTNADTIAERLSRESAKGKLSGHQMLRILSSWEIELNG